MGLRTFRGHPINWNRVFRFHQLAYYGSLETAASDLHLSQKGLIREMDRLELEMAFKLFIRRRKTNWLLTPEGKHFFRQAEPMF